MKNLEFVSRIVNDINALSKDVHVSRRWILSIGRQKALSYISQKWADGTLFGEESLYMRIGCLEMERVNSVDCCFAEFRVCRILMRSKERIPDLVYSSIGPAILRVSNVMDDIVFTPITLRRYSNDRKRRFGSIRRYNYYVSDGYIYIPDVEVHVINVDVITLDRKAALALSSCEPEKEDVCVSEWDYDFVCPAKLLEYVIAETLREVLTRLQIPVDENPDMDVNKKTQKIK